MQGLFVNVAKSCLTSLSYFVWMFKYFRLKLGFNCLKDIEILSVEFASICNLHCKYCHLERNERPRYLDINIYEKVIKEICENSKYNLKIMEWPVSGEFFVYPQYKEVLEITRTYMERYPRFHPYVILNDNMVLMNEENIELILKSGVVREVICSIDGYDPQTFEDMRPPAKFDVVYNNVCLLASKNKELGHPVVIRINNGREGCSLNKEVSPEMENIFSLGDWVTFWEPQCWNESFSKSARRLSENSNFRSGQGARRKKTGGGRYVEDFLESSNAGLSEKGILGQPPRFKPAKGFCSFVFNSVSLSSAGKIFKCCMDLQGATQYADFTQNTLAYIWHSPARKEFLGEMFRNKRKNLKGCGNCAITYTNNDNRYFNIWRKIKRQFSKS